MVRLDARLKYIFKNMRHNTVTDENTGKSFRRDMMVYVTFKGDELQGLTEDDFDLLHLDGDINNCALDNLELIVFEKENSLLQQQKAKVVELQKEIVQKNEYIKTISAESKAKDWRVDKMQKQVSFEQNRVKELNKELKAQEKEIRRLFALVSQNK